MAKLEISPQIIEALQKLSSLLESDDAVDRTLNTIVDLSVSTLPGCDAAGVTLRVEGTDTTAAASDSYTLELDKIQYDANEGPCLDALESGEPKQIEAISAENRWPEFRKRAAALGLRSSASFPLRVDHSIAALNLYSRKERAFDDSAVAIGEIFARQASIALENAHIYTAARRLADQLGEAVQTRDLIGQAKGIIMEREGISDGEAFEMLRTISQNTNIKLRDVAQRLVDEKARSDAGQVRRGLPHSS